MAFKQSNDFITPADVSDEFDIPEQTQATWRYLNRHGWRNLTLKFGRKVFYRRSEIIAWLEARRLGER